MDVFRLNRIILKKAEKTILQSIDWRVEQGTTSIVLGPTGSGKTSLLRLLNRLDDPTSGEIFYDGGSISSLSVPSLRREVGMVLQTPHLFEGTVEENIGFGPVIHGIEVDVQGIMSLAGLTPDLANRQVNTLSVGQAQKVSIARALAVGPRVLLLDEPTAALDPTSTLQTESLIKDLVKSLGLTCVFVTHDVQQAKRVGSRGMLLIDGKKVEEGPMVQLLDHPRDPRTLKFIRGELK
jgi:putative ABC transport system ATP-binding protein